MIYLIGGAPRCGKTTLSLRLARRLGISWVSADSLECIVYAHTRTSKRDKLFPKIALRRKTGGTNEEMYGRHSTREVANTFIVQARSSAKAIRAFVEETFSYGHDVVLEGHQLYPKLVAELLKKYPKEVRAIFLIKKDEQALVDGFTKNAAKRDWVVQRTHDPATYPLIAKVLAYYSRYLEKEAQKYGLAVHTTDKDFQKTITQLSKELGSKFE